MKNEQSSTDRAMYILLTLGIMAGLVMLILIFQSLPQPQLY
ncbi:hypothetical protein SAMN02745181_0098 [Rubritalea squalenifaciens DSM 18772]|uniref:Uncharacterized protein n=2 Tax=Rubritalea TaxID=361050 RepID=A0A1M6B2H4_9BACT|nr:hypothetical protein [Rubritalea squalenifaciens]SHI42798.1 hypothetical protein SAMN02745181_0098 [Rubritalea squalenifaciens DSM 18772]